MKVLFISDEFNCFTKYKVYEVTKVIDKNFVEVIDDDGEANSIDMDYAKVIKEQE